MEGIADNSFCSNNVIYHYFGIIDNSLVALSLIYDVTSYLSSHYERVYALPYV